ncbi:DUF4384 domain-containing protein [Paramagnetospirillum caucaseum]|nr:DUF4384 domain-containing protein [Paramagnetospirillum caucaseum]
MRKRVSLLATFVLLASPVSAEWVSASAYYMFPPSVPEEEACRQADSRARADAVRRVSGETLSSEEALRCSEQGDETECARNSTTWTMVGGLIRGTRGYRAETTIEAGAIRKCLVSFEADVFVAEGRPDPNFDAGVSLNGLVFRDGEKLVVSVTPSQPMHVQIFQWLPYEAGDAQIGRVFPNAFDSVDRVTKAFTVPSEAGSKRYELKVSYPTNRRGGRAMIDEYLMVVATKRPVAFRDVYSLDDFNRVIAEIPQDERRLLRRLYNVVRGGE